MKSFIKYIPVLLLVIIIIASIWFIIRNFYTIIIGVVIIFGVYIYFKSPHIRKKSKHVFGNISKKLNDFADDDSELDDDEGDD